MSSEARYPYTIKAARTCNLGAHGNSSFVTSSEDFATSSEDFVMSSEARYPYTIKPAGMA